MAADPSEQLRLLADLDRPPVTVTAAGTYGSMLAAARPGRDVVEFFSDTEQGSDPHASLTGVAWTSTGPAGLMWHALAVPNLIADGTDWSTQTAAMRLRCARAAVEHRYYGPHGTVLDLTHTLLAECAQYECSSRWMEFDDDGWGAHRHIDPENFLGHQVPLLNKDAPHRLCQHLRAASAAFVLARRSEAFREQVDGALTLLALAFPLRAQAVQYLLTAEDPTVHRT